MTKLQQTWRLIRGHGWWLLLLVLGIQGPLYAVEAVIMAQFGVAQADADRGLGLVMVFLMPLINGTIVWAADRWSRREVTPLREAVTAVGGYWARLFTTYVSVSFILLGWLVLTVLPPYIVMMILKVEQPFLLAPFAAFGVVMALSNYVFIDPLIVLGGLGPFHARHASVQLVKGRRLPVIAYGCLLYLLPLSLELAGELLPTLAEPTSWEFLRSAAMGLTAAVLYTIPVVFFYVYYSEVATAAATLRSQDASEA